jgi:RNA polymerase sigma-70 factor (ECF subfamily)
MADVPEDAEQRIAALLAAGDARATATLAIRTYGPQILGYVAAIVRDEATAGDVFSIFCEDLWHGVSSFRGESSFKAWAYRIAWHAALRVQRDPHRRRRVPLATDDAERLAAEVRSTTALHLRPQAHDALAEMRASLTPEDQALLTLRIDRDLAWSEIAEILGEGASSEATLRKRFERLKEKLRKDAVARGLIPGRGGDS